MTGTARSSPPPALVREYRINELSDVSGVSVRNIRVYQDRGLLPPPAIRGRTGWYSQEHLVRLNLISRMLERGYTFATISELLRAAHYGMKVEHVLRDSPAPGKLSRFRRAATITIAELRKSLNASDRAISLSQRLGLLVKDGAHYAVRNPDILEGAEVLVKGGIDVDVLLDRWVRIESDLADVARSFVSLITERYFGENLPRLSEADVTKVAELIQTVRPMAHELVESAFAKALDAEISKAIGEASTYFDMSTANSDPPGGDDGGVPGGDAGDPPSSDAGDAPGSDRGDPPGSDVGDPPGDEEA